MPKNERVITHKINTINQRVKDVVEHSGKTINSLSKDLKVSQPALRSVIVGVNNPGFEMLTKLIELFPEVDVNWLVTGKGSMLKKTDDIINPIKNEEFRIEFNNTSDVEVGNNINITLPESGTQKIVRSDGSVELASTNSNSVNYKLVPLLNLDAVGGMHSLNAVSDGPEYTERLIPFTDAQDGDIALIVSGNSMDPTCPAGSKVLLREVRNWQEYFGFGNIFVIHLTDDRRILKEVQKYPEDSKNYILCKSHNDKYPEEELPKSMIKSVWKVVKILNERGW